MTTASADVAPAATIPAVVAAATLSTTDDVSKVGQSPEEKAAADALAKSETDAKAKADADTKAAAEVKAKADADAETDRRAKLSPEQREAEDKAAKEKADADAKAKTVPEKYDLKVPDGVTLDAETSTAFEAKAKELGLSQQAAQELFDLGLQANKKQADAFTDKVSTTQASWLAAAQSDKEFGGDQLMPNMAVAKKAFDAFTTPEFKQMLNESKLGNHPEIIRFAYRVGKAMSEDGHVSGQPTTVRDNSEEARAKRIYPNQK